MNVMNIIIALVAYLLVGIDSAIVLFVILFLIDSFFSNPDLGIRSREDREDDY